MRRPTRRLRKRWWLVGLLAGLTLGPATFALAVPATATFALMAGVTGYTALPDGTLVDPARSPAERTRIQALRARARERIEAVFGAPRANPVVVFFGGTDTFKPLKLNPTAGTRFLPTQACVFVGPEGENVDVVAHELMHAELFDRVGLWSRITEVPMWFDEGIAMQLDHRDHFDLPAHRRTPAATAFAREIKTSKQFFGTSGRQLTANYAASKAEAARWLDTVGPRQLYARLQRLRAGESFDKAMDN